MSKLETVENGLIQTSSHQPPSEENLVVRPNYQQSSDIQQGSCGMIAADALKRAASLLDPQMAFETRSLILADNTQGGNIRFTVGMVNPDDHPSLQKVADQLNLTWRKINVIKIEEDDYLNLFQTAYGMSIPGTEGDEHIRWEDLVEFKKEESENQEDQKVEPAPTLGEGKARTQKEFAQQIMRSALQLGASDIHIDMGPRTGMVRLRIDGLLYSKFATPGGQFDLSDIDNRILIKLCGALGASAGVNYEAMLNTPQDGSLVLHYKNAAKETVDTRVRFASIPRKIENGDQRGAKVTLRLNQAMITNLDELGLEPEVKEIIRKGLTYIGGIAFVVGGTGSGKTNILASMHTILRQGYVNNVMEFADTIEQMFDGICQTETTVNCDEGDIIKSYLRHDPDKVIASEVRDKEATNKLVEIATAGKLVLSTLHANSLPGVFIRLEKLGIDRYTQSETLRFVVFTTLVRKLCSHCKVQGYRLRGFEKETYEYVASEKGCAHCRFVGYRGRTAIAEALCITPEVADWIADGERGSVICRKAEESGALFPLKESIGRKIAAGITSKAEILRVIDVEKRLSESKNREEKSNFDWREQPSKNESDLPKHPSTTNTQNQTGHINQSNTPNGEENVEKNYIDLEEIGSNSYGLEDIEVDFDYVEEPSAEDGNVIDYQDEEPINADNRTAGNEEKGNVNFVVQKEDKGNAVHKG